MRSLDAAEVAVYSGEHYIEMLFAELRFVSGTLYVHNTGLGPISWGGQTWQGVGSFGGISRIEDSSDLGIRSFTLSLSGIDPVLISTAIDRTDYKDREAIVYRGLIDADYALVATPKVHARGFMDSVTIQRKADVAEILMRCEAESMRLLRGRRPRISPEDHKRRHPGDTLLDRMPDLIDKDAEWGGLRISPFGGGRPGRLDESVRTDLR